MTMFINCHKVIGIHCFKGKNIYVSKQSIIPKNEQCEPEGEPATLFILGNNRLFSAFLLYISLFTVP